MLRIITVVDRNYLSEFERLITSLRSSGNRFRMTVYCDEADPFSKHSRTEDLDVVELPEIRGLGAKRAKFAAYGAAIRSGGFLYLDADIVVLERLHELQALETLAACPDDLSHCPGIPNKSYPWPNAPQLERRRYINSGVMWFPLSARGFVEHLHAQSLSDETWQKYIAPEVLYDNHFFCAHLNLTDHPLMSLDPLRYNWQGFLQHGQVQVIRKGDSLVNRESGDTLKLVHFAGIRNCDRFLCGCPVEVASLICERSAPGVRSVDRSLTDFLAALSPSYPRHRPNPSLWKLFETMFREVAALARCGLRENGDAASFLFDRPSLLSYLYSPPSSRVLWNGLPCGGAYLDGDEYNYLVRLIRSFKIRTVIETGAGQTSILFRRLGLDASSLEHRPGPWLERALREGSRCFVVPFDPRERRYDEDRLSRALASHANGELDLLFIDSPCGTEARRAVVQQLLNKISPTYILLHDGHRDGTIIFELAAACGFRIVDCYPTHRGLVLLSNKEVEMNLIQEPPDDAQYRSPGFDLELTDIPDSVRTGERFSVMIKLTNRSDLPFSSRYRHPVMVAYHWYAHDDTCLVFDGHRTSLPFDLAPGDTADFPITIEAPASPGECRLQVSLVQEFVAWFHQWNERLAVWKILSIREPPRSIQRQSHEQTGRSGEVDGTSEVETIGRTRPRRALVVSASDENFFSLTKGLYLSLISSGLPDDDVDLGFVDTSGSVAVQKWMNQLGVVVRDVSKTSLVEGLPDVRLPNARLPMFTRGQMVRPLLPRLFPEYEVFLWIDGDAWVQKRSSVDLLIRLAQEHPQKLCICTSVDSAYSKFYHDYIAYLEAYDRAYRVCYDETVAAEMRGKAILCSGAFSLSAQSPLWTAWNRQFPIVYSKDYSNHPNALHVAEQLALNVVAYRSRLFLPLDSAHDFMCHAASVVRDPRSGKAVVEGQPDRELGIVHLSDFPRSKRDYLSKGLLWSRGEYLDPRDREELESYSRR